MSDPEPLSLSFFDDLLFPALDSEADWDLFFNFDQASPVPLLNSHEASHIPSDSLGSPSQQQQQSSVSTETAGSPEPSHRQIEQSAVEGTSVAEDLCRNKAPSKEYQPKRGIQDCLSSFFVDQNSAPPPRKRQAFSSKEREKVALVRKIRACQRCRMRKLSCEATGVCEHCVNSAAGSVTLGEHICFRQTLVDLRYGGGDLLRLAQSKLVIKNLPKLNRPTPQTIYVWFRTDSTHEALRLEVHDYSESPNDNDELMTFTVTSDSLDQPQFSRILTPKYVIMHQSLPSATQLDEWIQQQIGDIPPGWSPATTLFNSFHVFLVAYCNAKPPLTLTELGFLKAALRIMNLYECWRNILSANKTPFSTLSSCVAKAAGIQIALVAKQGIAECEIQMLSKLDDIIHKSKRPPKDAELPIWIGVWTLILLYRDILRRYLHMSRSAESPNTDCGECTFTSSTSSSPRCNATKGFENSIFLARQMYNALTSTYNLLFRGRSLLDIDWQKDENFKRIGQNLELRTLLNTMKEQTQCFYYQPSELGEDHRVIQTLIAEQESDCSSLASQPSTHSTAQEALFSDSSSFFESSGYGSGGGASYGGGGYGGGRGLYQSPCDPFYYGGASYGGGGYGRGGGWHGPPPQPCDPYYGR